MIIKTENMATTVIQLYDTLRKSVGDVSAEAIATFVNSKIEKARQRDIEMLASKTDLNEVKVELKQDLNEIKIEFKQDFNALKIELKQDMNELKIDLNKYIEATKTDVIRWMLALFVTVILALAGLYFKK